MERTPPHCTARMKPSIPLYSCSICKEDLGRHRFAKKIFREWQKDPQGSSLVCQHCKREETARRCKQVPPRPPLFGRIADSGTKRRPNNFGYCDYVDKVFAMDCFASEIAPLRVFRSAKDVSESMAALQAIRKHGNLLSGSGEVLVLCIGDGCTPRTAVLLSFLAKADEDWECVSIDPALSEEWEGKHPKGIHALHGYKGTLEEFLKDPHRPPEKTMWKHLVLVCVHSHARFIGDASIDRIRKLYSAISKLLPTTIVSLPCCPNFRHVRDIGEPPHIKYDDDCVFSACRSVEVWNFGEEHILERRNEAYCTIIEPL